MKVFFDTNVYVAEALLGQAAEAMLAATERESWRVFVSAYVLNETERVLVELGFSHRFAILTKRRATRRARLVEQPASRHIVPLDPADTAILQAALACSADYLVTNDEHLLTMNPYEGLRIISMTDYFQLLRDRGMLV